MKSEKVLPKKDRILLIGPNSEITWFSYSLFNPIKDSNYLLSPFRELLLFDKIVLCLGLERMDSEDDSIQQIIDNKLIFSIPTEYMPLYLKWRSKIPFEEIDDSFARQAFLAAFELTVIKGYDFYPDIRQFELTSRLVNDNLFNEKESFYSAVSKIQVLNWLFDEKFRGIQIFSYDNLIYLRNQPEFKSFQDKVEEYANYLKYGLITDELKEIINKDINTTIEKLYDLVATLDGKTSLSKTSKITDVLLNLLGFVPVVGKVASIVGLLKSIRDLFPQLSKEEAKLIEWYIYILKIIKSSEYQYIADKDCIVCNPRPRVEIEELSDDECHKLCLSGKAFCFNHLPLYLSFRKYGLVGKDILLAIDDFIKNSKKAE